MPTEFIEGYGPAVLGGAVAPDDATDVRRRGGIEYSGRAVFLPASGVR